VERNHAKHDLSTCLVLVDGTLVTFEAYSKLEKLSGHPATRLHLLDAPCMMHLEEPRGQGMFSENYRSSNVKVCRWYIKIT
jgi:hypothetical protein